MALTDAEEGDFKRLTGFKPGDRPLPVLRRAVLDRLTERGVDWSLSCANEQKDFEMVISRGARSVALSGADLKEILARLTIEAEAVRGR